MGARERRGQSEEAAARRGWAWSFVGLDVGESSPEHARAFVDVNRVPYPNVYDPDGSRLRRFAGVLAPNAVPSTLVIDRQGRVAVRISGAVTRATLVELARDVATEPG